MPPIHFLDSLMFMISFMLTLFSAKAMAAQGRGGGVGEIAKKMGLASGSDLEEVAVAWEGWAEREDSSLAMIHGEIFIEK